MTVPAPASAASAFEHWRRHFEKNRAHRTALPWHSSDHLSPTELHSVAPSLQQFQLGEWARGRGFMRRAALHPAFAADSWFLPALELFIAEEQGHSAVLGLFLDHEQIPRLENHWLDAVFRRLRKLAGLELCATVLVTAEALAIPFYQALRDATRSRLLRAISVRILCDESAHLNYQALTLGLIRRRLSGRACALRSLGHSLLFRCTALTLWQQHRRVFRAAGWNFLRFWSEAGREFATLQFRIRQVSMTGACIDTWDDWRLD